MHIELKPYRILEYYDVPEIFIAKDLVDTKYLCVRINSEEKLEYISIPISNMRLHLFIIGKYDLRETMKNNEIGFWYLTTYNDDGKLISYNFEEGLIPEEYLPENGFFLNKHEYEDNLDKEIREFKCYVIKADTKNGKWRIYNIEDKKEYFGTSDPMNLNGITLSEKVYIFICNKEMEISNNGKYKYNLISKEEIN